jgi:hypothetical protein
MCDISIVWSKKKFTFGGQKGEKRPSEPTNEIWGPKSVWSCVHRSGILHGARKNLLLGVKKVKISLKPKSVWSCDI